MSILNNRLQERYADVVVAAKLWGNLHHEIKNFDSKLMIYCRKIVSMNITYELLSKEDGNIYIL